MAQLSFPGRMMGPRHGGAAAPINPGYYSGTANGSMPNTSLTLPGAQPVVISRIPLYFGWASQGNAWRMVFDNIKILSGGLILNPNSGVKTIRKCAIEKWDASVTIPCTFDGGTSRSKVLAAAGAYNIATDDCNLSWEPSSDGLFGWMRVETQHASSSSSAPAIWGRLTSDSQQFTYALVSSIDQVDLTGPLTKPAGAGTTIAGGAYVGVSFVIGKPADPARAMSIIVTGNSRPTDSKDVDTPAIPVALPIATGTTYWGRGASSVPDDGATPANILAMSRCSVTGAVMQSTYGAGAAGQPSLYAFQYGTHLYFEGDINDINAPVAVATIKATARTFLNLARSYGMRTISEVMPNRTGGAWTLPDGSDQVYLTNFGGVGGNLESINNDRLSMEGGLIDAVNRMKTPRNPSDPFKWKAPNWTNDGLHGLLATANAPMAYEARASIFLCQYRCARADVPSVTEMNAFFDLLAYMTTNQIYHKITGLWFHAVAARQAALVNMVDPFGPDTLAELGNALTFTAGRGFTGNPTTGRLSTTTLASAWPGWLQDDAGFGFAVSTVGNGALDMGLQAGARVSVDVGGNVLARINATAGDISVGVASGLGIKHAQRRDATTQQLWADGSLIGSNSTASEPVASWPITVLNAAGSGSSDEICFSYVGSLADGEIPGFHAALKACANAITPGLLP